MTQTQKILLLALRLSFGALFLYSGLAKVLDPAWSAAGYLLHAGQFSSIYAWLASDNLLPIINFLNSWGQLALGVSLIFGLFVRVSAPLGALLMLLYYLALPFPKVDSHSYIIDQHIIYALSLLVLGSLNSGKIAGFDQLLFRPKIHQN